MMTEQTVLHNPTESARCADPAMVSPQRQDLYSMAENVDAAIVEKVDRALWDDSVLRRTDYSEIDVVVKDGVVLLSGHVINSSIQKRAEDAARSVSGVLAVKNYLVPDDKIIRELAGVLGMVERQYGDKFFSGVNNGVVVLSGKARIAAARSLAQQYAANVPGVRAVLNSIQAPGVDLPLEAQRFLQPTIDQQIYFRDGISGTVDRVIINPQNRCVTAMVIRGRFLSTEQDPRSLTYGREQAPERLIVIPMSAIRYITRKSGFLLTDSSAVAGYPEFEPALFVTPSEDWTPPYPYCRGDVWFPVELVEELSPKQPDPVLIPEQIPSTPLESVGVVSK